MSEHIIPNTVIARIYNATANTLRNEGWVKGENYHRDEDGNITGYCLSGAMLAAVHRLHIADHYHRQAITLLNNLSPIKHDFVRYNDAEDTTLDDVITLLHEAQDVVLSNPPKTPPEDDEDDEDDESPDASEEAPLEQDEEVLKVDEFV